MTFDYDLVVIVPDKSISSTIETLLKKRQKSLGIDEIKYLIVPHPHRDSGVRAKGAEFTRNFKETCQYCLLIFDREGSGGEDKTSQQLRDMMLEELDRMGWGGRADVIVIKPELEMWLWGSSHHLQQTIGWKSGDINDWIRGKGFQLSANSKPTHPKEALKAILKEAGRPYSASIYKDIAAKHSLIHCHDPSFNQLCNILRSWFPAERP